jgi:hypothetical protein
MRHITSCAVIARQQGLFLAVDPTKSLSAGFFLRAMCRAFTFVPASSWESRCRLVSEDDAYEFVLKRHPYTNWHPLVEAELSEGGLGDIDGDGVAIMSIYAAKPRMMSDAEYLARKVEWYAGLEWPRGLREGAKQWTDELRRGIKGNARLIGLHIRFTDNLKDSNKVENGLNTPIETFIQALGEVCRGGGGVEEDGTRVLLCTDSAAARRMVQAAGFDCLKPPQVSKEKYAQALFEMFLLGYTDLIIGSSSSTFSFEAAFLGGGTDIMLHNSGLWQTWHFGGAGAAEVEGRSGLHHRR